MKKRIFAVLMALCMVVALMPTAFAANDTEGGEATGDKTTPGYYDENDGHAKQVVETFDFVENDIAYKIVDGGVEVAPWYWVWQHICYSDDAETQVKHHTNNPAGREYDGKSIEIPVTVAHNGTTYDVIGIRAAAFANVKNCTITFAAGTKISYIGINAFQYCQGTTMTIPATVKSIGSRCFESSDMDIKFEANSQLEEIGSYAFAESTSTAELVLPEGVTTVDEALFAKSTFSKVTIPGTVTNLTGSTLVNYTGDITFTEGDANFQIQDGILYGYGKLLAVRDAKETVVVPEGITEIGATAFRGNTTMKSITLPDSLTTIGQAAFRSCTALESIVIPEKVTELPAPNPSDKVNTALFAGCTRLKSVTIKAPVSEIPENAFSQCSSLESVTLPDTVETIGQSAFYRCTNLSNINMPDSLETIDKLAFAYCSSLAEADLPDGLETIGASAFLNCSSLKTIIIPEGVTEISQSLLGNCTGLETVVLPSTITTIGQYAFNGDFKNSGSTLIIKSETAPTVTTLLWKGTAPSAENLTIIVPDGSESNYSAAGSVFKTYITTTDGENETTKDGISYKLEMSETVSIVNGERESLGTAIVPTGWTLSVEPSSNDVVTISGPDKDTGAVTATANSVGTVTLKFSIKNETSGIVLAEGTSAITVTAKPIPATGITLNKTSVTLYSNTTPNTATLTATVAPADSTDAVTWTSNNTNVATIDANGNVTAVANGTATVTATAGSYSATCTVTVKTYSSGGGGSSTPTYTITTPSKVENGTVSVSPKNASKGTTVTVTVTPETGYETASVTVTDANGNELKLTDKGNGKYTFTMPAGKVIVDATFTKIAESHICDPYVDVNTSAWYHDAVDYVLENGIMNGTGANTFAPTANLSRAMLMTMLARLDGVDTSGGATWYEKGMSWAVANGVSDGTNPSGSITREQIAVMLYRYSQLKGYDTTKMARLDAFVDGASTSAWAVDGMQWAVGSGVLNGKDGNRLDPQGAATRAEVAQMLMNFAYFAQ